MLKPCPKNALIHFERYIRKSVIFKYKYPKMFRYDLKRMLNM